METAAAARRAVNSPSPMRKYDRKTAKENRAPITSTSRLPRPASAREASRKMSVVNAQGLMPSMSPAAITGNTARAAVTGVPAGDAAGGAETVDAPRSDSRTPGSFSRITPSPCRRTSPARSAGMAVSPGPWAAANAESSSYTVVSRRSRRSIRIRRPSRFSSSGTSFARNSSQLRQPGV